MVCNYLKRLAIPTGFEPVTIGLEGRKPTVKIGFSKNLQGRLEKLRNGNSFPVFICKFVNGDRKTERSFHKRFAEYRLRGEWFDLRGSLAKYLEMHFRPIGLPPPLNDPEPEWDIIL
jgi:hypothetical protein